MAYAANDIASVIIARSGSFIGAMQLQKLLYYMQAWHLAITDRPLFNEECRAWTDGPVVSEVWIARKNPDTRAAGRRLTVELDETASDIVDLVLQTYGSMSGDELSALAHTEVPWREARRGLAPHALSDRPLSRETMAKFYRAHRKLGGRTAADLAAVGMLAHSSEEPEPLDIDAFLDGLDPEFHDPGVDLYGGANLETPDSHDTAGIATAPQRRYADDI
jgi:uncharacterized phage-associated protein